MHEKQEDTLMKRQKGSIRGRIELAITLGTILIIVVTVVNSAWMTRNTMDGNQRKAASDGECADQCKGD